MTAMFLEGEGKNLDFMIGIKGRQSVLDDNVAGAADDAETLAHDDTGIALTDEGLVGVDGNTEATGVVAVK